MQLLNKGLSCHHLRFVQKGQFGWIVEIMCFHSGERHLLCDAAHDFNTNNWGEYDAILRRIDAISNLTLTCHSLTHHILLNHFRQHQIQNDRNYPCLAA